jgi:hypothetical protein
MEQLRERGSGAKIADRIYSCVLIRGSKELTIHSLDAWMVCWTAPASCRGLPMAMDHEVGRDRVEYLGLGRGRSRLSKRKEEATGQSQASAGPAAVASEALRER